MFARILLVFWGIHVIVILLFAHSSFYVGAVLKSGSTFLTQILEFEDHI
jgi:hypothetical protein